MSHHADHQQDDPANRKNAGRSFWASPAGLGFVALLGIAGFFLYTEHRAHLFGILPWLLILACPLLHIFTHGGHGGHGHGGGKPDSPDSPKQ